jgi:hypothetical protein
MQGFTTYNMTFVKNIERKVVFVYYWGTLFRFSPRWDMWSHTSSTFGSQSSTCDVNWQLGTCSYVNQMSSTSAWTLYHPTGSVP